MSIYIAHHRKKTPLMCSVCRVPSSVYDETVNLHVWLMQSVVLYALHFICEESYFTKVATLTNFHNALLLL